MDWNPIDTVPKNTTVLVFMEDGVFQGFYNGRFWIFPFANYHGCGCCSDIMDSPSHWMPMPQPPEEAT